MNAHCQHCNAPLAEGRGAKFCGQSCYWDHMRENGRPTIRKAANIQCAQCAKPFYAGQSSRENGKRFCSNSCRGAWQSALPYAEWRGKLSASRANRQYGADNPRFGKPPLHPGPMIPFTRLDGVVVKMRSSWEIDVARYLDAHGLAWEYEPRRFDLGETTYVPDFYLTDLGVFWEVKGWFNDRAKTKAAAFRMMFPEETLVMVTKPVFAIIANDNRKRELAA
jgi:hypothetical protein